MSSVAIGFRPTLSKVSLVGGLSMTANAAYVGVALTLPFLGSIVSALVLFSLAYALISGRKESEPVFQHQIESESTRCVEQADRESDKPQVLAEESNSESDDIDPAVKEEASRLREEMKKAYKAIEKPKTNQDISILAVRWLSAQTAYQDYCHQHDLPFVEG